MLITSSSGNQLIGYVRSSLIDYKIRVGVLAFKLASAVSLNGKMEILNTHRMIYLNKLILQNESLG